MYCTLPLYTTEYAVFITWSCLPFIQEGFSVPDEEANGADDEY